MEKLDVMGMFNCGVEMRPTNSFRFGAVLEEFEVRDALESVFYAKQDVKIEDLKMAITGY